MDTDEPGKICRLCGEQKALTAFYASTDMRDGYRGECKQCNLAHQARRRHADPELRRRAVERAQAWRRDNPERYADMQREWAESGRKAASMRKAHLKRKYGITPDDYERRLQGQGGGCAICGAPPRAGQSLHVDHDHQTGRVRGLLCFNCNAGIGKFIDDPELLHRAGDYVSIQRRIAALTARR